MSWGRPGSGQRAVVSLPARGPVRLSHILLVLDDLVGQEELVRVTCHLTRRLDADLLVEHVVECSSQRGSLTYTPTDPQTAESLIDDVLERVAAEGIRAQGEVTVASSGFKARAILSAAVESRADLIVIEAHRLSPLLALVGLSPVHQIVRFGQCPVLLVPELHRPSLVVQLKSWVRRTWAW